MAPSHKHFSFIDYALAGAEKHERDLREMEREERARENFALRQLPLCPTGPAELEEIGGMLQV